MACGGGTIADLLPKEERGAATALFTAEPLLGPAIGPIIGGFVTQALGWRWTFYLVLILVSLHANWLVLDCFLQSLQLIPLLTFHDCFSNRIYPGWCCHGHRHG